MSRDWLHVRSEINLPGRVLTKTPHEIGVIVAHQQINYGMAIEADPYVLKCLKRAIFSAVRDTIVCSSLPQEKT